MPGTIYTYPDGSKVEVHPDGSITKIEPNGDSMSLGKDGTIVIKKKGKKPRVIKAMEVPPGSGKWVFQAGGKGYKVQFKAGKVTIKRYDTNMPPNLESDEDIDTKNGEKKQDFPKPPAESDAKTKPSSSETVPDAPEDNGSKDAGADSPGGGGGGGKKDDKKKKKKKAKRGRKR